ERKRESACGRAAFAPAHQRVGQGEPDRVRQRVDLVRGVIATKVVVSHELDPFLDLRALSVYASLSVRKLRDLLDDPERPLPCYQVGGKLLVRRSEFDTWMAAHRRRGRADVDRIVNDVLHELSGNRKQ